MTARSLCNQCSETLTSSGTISQHVMKAVCILNQQVPDKLCRYWHLLLFTVYEELTTKHLCLTRL